MALSLISLPSQSHCFLESSFLASPPSRRKLPASLHLPVKKKKQEPPRRNARLSISCSSPKIVRSPAMDKFVVKQNKTRFVQKLKTLLLSKPKHYLPLHILSKCRSYLSLTDSRSIRSMIHRYPSIFELFSIPIAPTPFNATKPYAQLCVRLTPAAAALAAQESSLHSAISLKLAEKLQKLLMLSSHRRLLLSKLVHLSPDLGLPPNFRSRLCNDHPDKFKTVDTSYGRALELVSWNADTGVPLSRPDVSRDLIVDRPLKFKELRLRKGLNVKRRHRDFLIKFGEVPDLCPYETSAEELAKESIEAEKRACAVVREVLAMTIEKRTLIDHLTHFRKEFGLPNKLRGMILRHPELFYVSLKGQRDSVFLVEGFDERGRLLEKDETLVIRERLMKLVSESKRMRREKRKGRFKIKNGIMGDLKDVESGEFDVTEEDFGDGFENVFESGDPDVDFDFDFDDDSDGWNEFLDQGENSEFWTADASSVRTGEDGGSKEPW